MQQSYDFPADTAVLEKIGKLAIDAGSNAGFNDIEIGDIQLAIDEVCAEAAVAVSQVVRVVDPSARVNPGHSTNLKIFKDS